MSNFFARLSARTAAEPAIQPRAVSRFESAPSMSVPALAVSEKETMIDAPLSAQATQTGYARHVADTVASERVTTTSSLTMTAAGSLAPMPYDVPTRDRRDVRPGQLDASAPVRAAAFALPGLSDTARLATPLATRIATPHESAESLSPRETRDAAVHPVSTRVDAPRQSITPAFVAPLATRAMQRDVVAAPREPDVIRVHIARVDVRAVMPAGRAESRTSPRSPEQRSMSLERYLGAKGSAKDRS